VSPPPTSASATAEAVRFPTHTGRRITGAPLGIGLATAYLSIIVLIPLALVVSKSTEGGWDSFWNAISSPQATSTLKLTITCSLIVVAVNIFMGTLIAWVLVRDDFRGKALVNSLIDLPFALPTIVAGLTLLALYGPKSPFGLNAAYTQAGLVMALLFVTLPFVVRAVQPVLMELDKDMEEASESLGASRFTTFRRIVLPNLRPAILAGAGLAFARAMGEFGAVVLISGNIPFETQVSSVFIYSQVESNNLVAAAAISVVLLVVSLIVLMLISLLSRWAAKHEL
jgi:sulfate/thiosulfate transport system permease protein